MARGVPVDAVGAVVGVVVVGVGVVVDDAPDEGLAVDGVVAAPPDAVDGAVDAGRVDVCDVTAPARAANTPVSARPAAPTAAVRERTRRVFRRRSAGEGVIGP